MAFAEEVTLTVWELLEADANNVLKASMSKLTEFVTSCHLSVRQPISKLEHVWSVFKATRFCLQAVLVPKELLSRDVTCMTLPTPHNA